MSENRETHPSYGMLGFNHRYGSETALFGSSIRHSGAVVMTLKHGEVDRHLNKDWYCGRGVIAEVEMSYSQFAEAITSMGMGDGVPVTIRYTEKDGHVKERPFVSKQEQFEQEFSEHLEDIKNETQTIINEVAEIFDTKKAIGKGDRDLILKKLRHLAMQIGSNTEFIYEQFNEQMDKTVMEAKGEVESFCENKLKNIAYAALSENKELFTGSPISIEMTDKKTDDETD